MTAALSLLAPEFDSLLLEFSSISGTLERMPQTFQTNELRVRIHVLAQTLETLATESASLSIKEIRARIWAFLIELQPAMVKLCQLPGMERGPDALYAAEYPEQSHAPEWVDGQEEREYQQAGILVRGGTNTARLLAAMLYQRHGSTTGFLGRLWRRISSLPLVW